MSGSKYVLKIVDMLGNVYATITDAAIGNISWGLYEAGSISFTLPTTHPKFSEVRELREVQVWRNGEFMEHCWYVITRSRATGNGVVTFDGKTLDWYFSRRVFGPVPRRGLFGQPRFEQGWNASWTLDHLPGSVPAGANPAASISTVQRIEGGHSLMIAPSGGRAKKIIRNADLFTTIKGDTLSDTGKSKIRTIVRDTFGDDPRITVNVYHSNELTAKEARQITEAKASAIEAYILTLRPGARVYAQGLGEKNPEVKNDTAARRQRNRRAEFIYKDDDSKKGHKQFIGQEVTLKNPVSSRRRLKVMVRAWVYIEDFAGPAANQWGLVLERRHPTKTYAKGPRQGMKKVVQRAVVPITKHTPMNRWIRMTAAVYLPPDGRNYTISAMLFPPLGLSYVDEFDLFTDDALRYIDTDEGDIIQGIIDHAQDIEAGKSSLNILTDIRPTGIKRTREYRFSLRENVLEALREFPTLYQGAEWDIVCTPTTRTFTTYYPRKSADREYALTYGDNLYDFELDTDNEQTSDQVIILKEGDDIAREERSVTDDSLLDGLILEKAYDATPGSSLSSLRAQAVRGIERYRHPVEIPVLMTDPRRCTEILDNVATGDVVNVDAKKGPIEVKGKYRVLTMTLDPNSDHIALEATPEDEKVTTILPFGSTGWKYTNSLQTVTEPTETNPEWAERDFDDTAWATGQAPFGWFHHGPGGKTSPEVAYRTALPKKHEVWMRRTVAVTEEMYVSVKVDRWAFIYVNGNLLTEGPLGGLNFRARAHRGPVRVPDEFLDLSGQQVVTLHVQDNIDTYNDDGITDFLIADMKVRGIYNAANVGPEYTEPPLPAEVPGTNEGGTSNDLFADAWLVYIDSAADSYVSSASDNAGYTTETGEPIPSAAPSGLTAWWTYTPTESGIATFDGSGSDGDAEIAVYTGASVDALTQVAYGASGTVGLDPVVLDMAVTAGTTYYVQMASVNSVAMTYQLSVTGPITVEYTAGG